jgi:glycosyltransferase involved in cell wall biosynthesis
MVRSECRSQLNWPSDAKIVLFAADPARPEKNYQLALDASKLSDGIVLKTAVDVNHIEMPKYYNAANLLLLTSLWEGSPNVVKEAMACNLPIVSTDVGDVSWLLGDLDGHFIIEKDPSLVSKSINKALEFDKPTSGRSRIIELGLDSPTIASRLLDLYKGSLRQSRNT